MTPTRPPVSLLQMVEQASAQHGLPTGLLEGLIQVESGWNPHAVGQDVNSIDRGLVQINSVAHPEVSAAEAYSPSYAIPWAAQYLSGLIRQCGSVVGGLEAYNSGRCQGDTGYASQVLRAAQRYGLTSSDVPAEGISLPPSPSVPKSSEFLPALAILGLVVALVVAALE